MKKEESANVDREPTLIKIITFIEKSTRVITSTKRFVYIETL